MKRISCIASVDSRLQADIIAIRLRRAGIADEKISALFHRRCMPNAVICWLRFPEELNVNVDGDQVMAAGPLSARLADAPTAPSTMVRMEEAGFDHHTAHVIEEWLAQGRILLFVHTANNREIALARQIFKDSSADVLTTTHENPHHPRRPGAAAPVLAVA